MAYSQLKEYYCERAKLNKEMILNEKRDKVMGYMRKWDEYRVRKEQVVTILMKKKR